MPIFNIHGNPGTGKNYLLLPMLKDKDTSVTLSSLVLNKFFFKALKKYSAIIIDEADYLREKHLKKLIKLEKETGTHLYIISQSPVEIPVPHSKYHAQFFHPVNQESTS